MTDSHARISRPVYIQTIVHCCLPAAPVTIVYYVCLGHRRDYLGHFSAGYGGTLIALVLAIIATPQNRFVALSGRLVICVTLFCIVGGILAEATVFRLAIFDLVDMCNQNIGAVLAGLTSIPCIQTAKQTLAANNQPGDAANKPSDSQLRSMLACGIGFLLLGTYFAVT